MLYSGYLLVGFPDETVLVGRGSIIAARALDVLGYAWPGCRRLFNGHVVGIQGRVEQHDGGDATCHVGHLACLIGGDCSTQQPVLAIAKPLLDDLIAADSILPDASRDIAPVGSVVQVDIAGCCTQAGDSLLLS